MQNTHTRIAVAALACAALLPAVAHANGAYRIAGAELTVVCPLTVGGSFEARTKTLSGEVTAAPGDPTLRGTLQVDLQTLETGIGLRDRHMRDNYLEVKKGPEYAVATLEQIRIEKLDGQTTFKGTLLLHGQRKEVTGTAQLKQQDGRVRVDAEFPVRVSEFAIPKPTYLGVGVTDEVKIKVSMTAERVQLLSKQ
jgi:polyisoprenoid-binding protein YceI